MEGKWNGNIRRFKSDFTLTQAEVGKKLSVEVSYTDGGGTVETLQSDETLTSNVTIRNWRCIHQWHTLTRGDAFATNNLADADGLGLISYIWKADDEAINGAIAESYTLSQSEVGKAITVELSYTDSYDTIETIESSATGLVDNLNDKPTGNVFIEGTAFLGGMLMANASSVDDLDGLGIFSYQWKSDDVDILDAVNIPISRYKRMLGKSSVSLSYTDGEGTPENLNSQGTPEIVVAQDYTGDILTDEIEPIQAAKSTRGMEGSLDDRNPQIAVVSGQDGDETVVLTWQGETSDHQVFDIFASIVDENQNSIRLDDRPDGFADQTPQITALGSDGFAIVWQSVSELNSSVSDIYVQTFDVNGNPVSLAQKLQGFSMVGEFHVLMKR